MGQNVRLKEHLKELGLTHTELVDRLNTTIEKLTGRYGTVTEKSVHNWTMGVTRWPQARQRIALEAVFGCTAEQLGFHPRGQTVSPTVPTEQPVQRRSFIATTAAAVVPVPSLVVGPSVGSAELIHLRESLASLISIDQRHGGHAALERTALAGADEALALQERSASQRTRQRLYSLAAEFIASAAFSCIDSYALGQAQEYLNRGIALATLSADPIVQVRIWNLVSMLAIYRNRPSEAVAAAEAAGRTAAAKHDPSLASLAYVRAANGLANQSEGRAALRRLGKSMEMLHKSEDQERPSWATFMGVGEIEAIATAIYYRLGDYVNAEAAANRALAETPEKFRRNQALIYVHLGRAQLLQGEADHACANINKSFDLMSDYAVKVQFRPPVPGRMRALISDFQRNLLNAAPTSVMTRAWLEEAFSEWNQIQ